MYQTEPILSEDKEKQAQARGQRLGGHRSVEITQLLMAGTIEDHMWKDRWEMRDRTKQGRESQADLQEGKRARMMKSLKLLKPPPEKEDESESEEEEAAAAEEMEAEEVEAEAEVELTVKSEHASSSGAGPSRPADDPKQVAQAKKDLQDFELTVDVKHVRFPGPQYTALPKWRKELESAPTLMHVAASMLELQQSMLIELGQDLDLDDHDLKPWHDEVRSQVRDPDFPTLQGLLQRLEASYERLVSSRRTFPEPSLNLP